MKPLIFFLMLSLILGCESQKSREIYSNRTEQNFVDFLNDENNKKEYGNEIKTKQFQKDHEKRLELYLDSSGLFKNWTGIIKEIKTSEYDTVTEVTCNIEIEPEEYQKITLVCGHVFSTKKSDSDFLYNKLKEINDGSAIYFDGYIARNSAGEILYDNVSEDLKLPYPNFHFRVVNISSSPLMDTLNPNLQTLIDGSFVRMRVLREYTEKRNKDIKIPEGSITAGRQDSLTKILTPSEQQYLKRVDNYLLGDFFYAN